MVSVTVHYISSLPSKYITLPRKELCRGSHMSSSSHMTILSQSVCICQSKLLLPVDTLVENLNRKSQALAISTHASTSMTTSTTVSRSTSPEVGLSALSSLIVRAIQTKHKCGHCRAWPGHRLPGRSRPMKSRRFWPASAGTENQYIHSSPANATSIPSHTSTSGRSLPTRKDLLPIDNATNPNTMASTKESTP